MRKLGQMLVQEGGLLIDELDRAELELELNVPMVIRAGWEHVFSPRFTIWEETSYEGKLAAIAFVRKNCCNDQYDFGHSQCCSARNQAAAFFLVDYALKNMDSGDYFDDLDFVNIKYVKETA